MARRTSSRSRSTRSRQEAPAKSSRRTAAAAPAVAVAEAETTDDGATGIAVLTTVLLLAALLCVDALLGRYGSGLFF